MTREVTKRALGRVLVDTSPDYKRGKGCVSREPREEGGGSQLETAQACSRS